LGFSICPRQRPEQEKDVKICSTTADVLKNLADEKVQEASFPEADWSDFLESVPISWAISDWAGMG
jgi:hypothetical protein